MLNFIRSIFKQKKKTVGETHKSSPKRKRINRKSSLGVTVSVVVSKSPEAERISTLNKLASENKGVDWSKAIECLREAKSLVQSRRNDYPIEHHLRLPLFLQQAGDMKGAKAEFDFLLGQSWHPHEEAKIYDKMRLAYQREGDYENAIVYGSMYAAMEFGNEKDKDEYMAKRITPLYKKAQKSKK